MTVVNAPSITAVRVFFFRRSAPFLDDPKRLVLVDDRNAILDPKKDSVCGSASESGRRESSLVDLMARHDMIDWFCLYHQRKEMRTWLESSPSVCIKSYLERVVVRRADADSDTYPTFHWIRQTERKHIRISLKLANRPSLAGYWKFNSFLLEKRDFQDWLGSLIKQALMGPVTEIGGRDLSNIGLDILLSNTVDRPRWKKIFSRSALPGSKRGIL